MKTSKTIKRNQCKPPAVLHEEVPGRWRVEGRDRPSYGVVRDGRMFRCSCQAGGRGYLCRHVQAVIGVLARAAGYDIVQFWTDLTDAKRQRRKTVEFVTPRRRFWVTYAQDYSEFRALLPRWLRGIRITSVKEDPYQPGLYDVFWMDDGLHRYPVRREG